MATTEIPKTKPVGDKDSSYWNWFVWYFHHNATIPPSYFRDYLIGGPIRFTAISTRRDATAILIKYDNTDM